MTAAVAAAGFLPARRLEGQPPRPPSPLTVGAVEEAVDLTVDAAGRVEATTLLRGGRPADSLIAPIAKSWRFRAASDGGKAVRSHVLFALVVRAPQLYDGPTLGTPSGNLAAPSDDIPYPTAFLQPRYPLGAVGDGMIVVEVLVGVDGGVVRAEVIQGAGILANESLQTARRWTFRPAVRRGKPVEAYAYIGFGFRQPVTTTTPPRGRGR
jgi:outer membrane biosynthesis protein TonB